MKQLSGLDASFLHLETPEMPMHVGGLHLFDLPDGHSGDFYEDVTKHVASRMHLAEIFTKKLALMPFDLANPVWVKDGDVDLDYHIRRITLPRPGTMAQLEAYVGRLHSSLLDRSRPLWEFYVFDGLQSGQAAFYTKIHHAALDGQGAHALAQAVLDLGPEPRPVPPAKAPVKAPGQPSAGELLGTALRNNLSQYWKIVKHLPDAAKAIGSLMLSAKGEDGKRRIGLPVSFRMGPKTPLNGSITSQRVFASARIPLADAKGIAKAYDASLNDAVMAICSGALRRYLEAKGALPDKPLTAALPVSLREQGNTELNNQVSMMLVKLPTDQADPKSRMRDIVKSSKAMKATLSSVKSILPTDFPSLGAPWLMSGLAAIYSRTRLADRMAPMANVVISNVPGVPVPLYMAGARMASYYPVSIVTHGLGLNITVHSYNGALDFGFVACRRAMPDVREFARCVLESHAEMMAQVPAVSAAERKKPLKRAAAPKVEAMPPIPKTARNSIRPRTRAVDSSALASITPLPPASRGKVKSSVKPKDRIGVRAAA